MQNRYSVADRAAEPVLDYCRAKGIAFIPWFPIGGGDLGDAQALTQIAKAHDASDRQIALAWLLHHADNILLIPGTSKIARLEENMTVDRISLSPEELATLDAIGTQGGEK